MTDLVVAIRAAIDETEQVAKSASGWSADGRTWRRDLISCVEDGDGRLIVYGEGTPTSAQADHIARHDPAAVLRRCAADRKILDAWDANERELEANSAEFSRPARPMENEAERFRRLGNAKAQGWELQGRRWALRVALTGLAEAYGVEEKA